MLYNLSDKLLNIFFKINHSFASVIMDRKRFLASKEMVKAIQENNCQVVNKLLDEGFDVDAELMLHKHAIMICIECDSLEIGEILINHGCSLSLKTLKGSTALHLAVQLLNFDFVKLLLNNRADLTSIDDDGKTSLHIAAGMNSLKMVKLLMEKEIPGILNIMDKEGKTPFIYACCHGDEALVTYFLSKGTDTNKIFGPYQNTPLLSALSNPKCSPRIISKLLDAGANINYLNKLNETPLLKAFHMIGKNNFSEATYKQFRNVCCLLVDRGSEVNIKNSLGDTPLHFSVIMNDELLVCKLLNAGSYINCTNRLGLSPLIYACRYGLQKIAALLLNNGASSRFLLSQIQLTNDLSKNPVLIYVLRKSKECQSLRNLCRIVVRKNLPKNIEKSALLLPLPSSLVEFVKFV